MHENTYRECSGCARTFNRLCVTVLMAHAMREYQSTFKDKHQSNEWRKRKTEKKNQDNLLLGTNPSRYHMILNAMGQCEVVVSWCGHITILHQSVVKMTVETFLYFTHIFNLSNTTNTDLFSLFNI